VRCLWASSTEKEGLLDIIEKAKEKRKRGKDA